MEDFGETDIFAGARFHDLAVLAEDTAERDVPQVAGNTHRLRRGKNLLEVQCLRRADHIPDRIGVPPFHAVVDRREVGGGVKKPAIGLADDRGLFGKRRDFRKENAERPVALAGDAALLQFGTERGEGVVVGALAEALVKRDIEKVVEFFEFAPREFHRLTPDPEVLRIARLQLHQLLAGGAFDFLVGFLESRDLTVEADEFGDRIRLQRGAVQQMLPAVNDFPELRAPIADVVVGDDGMPEEPRDAHEAIAENRAPDVTDMHRLRDIRRTEIHDDLFRLRRHGHTEARVGREFRNALCHGRRLETEIDEPGAGDFRRRAEA